jgi:hypothetical protein
MEGGKKAMTRRMTWSPFLGFTAVITLPLFKVSLMIWPGTAEESLMDQSRDSTAAPPRE